MSKSPPRKERKARVWKAWAHLHDPPATGIYGIFMSRYDATHQAGWAIKYQPGQLVRVEIREVRPAPRGRSK